MTQQCDKCEKEIQEFENDLVDAKCLKFTESEEDYYVVRCNECYAKDKTLTMYKKCEVFSRVCGYMRPTTNWHKGKQQEYKERLEFKNPD